MWVSRTGIAKRLAVAAVLAGLAFAAAPAALGQPADNRYKLYVDGLACPFCAYGVEKKVTGLNGVEKVEIDIDAGLVAVTMAEGASLTEDAARKAVDEAGFTLREFEPAKGQ